MREFIERLISLVVFFYTALGIWFALMFVCYVCGVYINQTVMALGVAVSAAMAFVLIW